MRLHKNLNDETRAALDIIAAAFIDKSVPAYATPGTLHGQPCTVVAMKMEHGNGGAAMVPVAIVVTTDLWKHVTVNGTTSALNVPSGPAPTVSDEAAMALLRDLAATDGVLGERAQHLLSKRPSAPAAPAAERVGVYL